MVNDITSVEWFDGFKLEVEVIDDSDMTGWHFY